MLDKFINIFYKYADLSYGLFGKYSLSFQLLLVIFIGQLALQTVHPTFQEPPTIQRQFTK